MYEMARPNQQNERGELCNLRKNLRLRWQFSRVGSALKKSDSLIVTDNLRISAAMTSLLSLAMVENFLGSLLSRPFTFPLAVVHEGMGQ